MSKATASAFQFLKKTFDSLSQVMTAAETEFRNLGFEGTLSDATCTWTRRSFNSGGDLLPAFLMRSYSAVADPKMDRLLLFGIDLDVAGKPWDDQAVVLGGCVRFKEPREKSLLYGSNGWYSEWLLDAALGQNGWTVAFDQATGTWIKQAGDAARESLLSYIRSFAVPLESVQTTAALAGLVRATAALYEDRPQPVAGALAPRGT